ncbi:MAG: hypothetical protein HEQ11_20915 [Gemmatimonas sp.]
MLLLDGKSFADDQVVIALGVTTTGEKRILGLVQTATENKRVCAAFLRELVERGFQTPAGLLVVLDGAKGLSAAVREVFGEQVPIQRCQWHKRENVLSYLPKTQHALWRRKLQAAYAKSTFAEAQRALRLLVKALAPHNASAARSLEEGLDETLTLHRLDVFAKLGLSFKTTNLIERVMARVEAKTHRITRWRTSDQKQRWCAATRLEIEKQFRKVKGHQHLGLLQAALRGKLSSPLAAA